MSAFMVEDKTINKIVTYLATDRGAGRYIKGKLEALGICALNNGNLDDEAAKLGVIMFSLNIDAITSRYGEGAPEEFRSLDYAFRWEIHADRIFVLKALRCYLYQCSEGDVPKTSLFQILREYSNELAHEIVSDLPRYQQAPWG